MKEDLKEHESCPLKWDCKHCSKNLCVQLVAVAEFPTMFGNFKILGFTNNKDKKDHIIIVKGEVSGKSQVLTRIHSSCATGDSLGSLRCDCGPQLRKSMQKIEEFGQGILIYMQQEGRGIGLTNKIRAYMLQDQGMDTYDANIALGFEPDERDYEVTAAMLKKLNVESIIFLTNNPDKIEQLRKFGILITKTINLELEANEYNIKYYETKREKFGHKLNLNSQHSDPCGCNQ
ncbi:GTP cyclohydrolase II [Candidatus Bathyarchaeota archaeon]|nr:GTP cyclohydrolase II [Candidatus Bathyarchaeota archaeon]